MKNSQTEHINQIEMLDVSDGISVVIYVDDKSVEEEAIKQATYSATDESEARILAPKIGNKIATRAVMDALRTVDGAFNPDVATDVEVNSRHDIEL